MNKRNLFGLSIVVLSVVALLAACSPAAPAPQDQPETAQADSAQTETQEGSLTVLDWPMYDAPYFWTKFAEAYPDVSVDAAYFELDADALAKMQSGFPVDLVHPCSSWWGLYVDEGLVQPIDTSRLSNWPDVVPELAELGQFNGEQYFVPWDYGYESILVRTDKVDKIPTSWADLWDPAYAGRLSIPDNAEINFLTTALSLGIEDPWNTTPEQDEMIKQKLIELKPNILTYWIDSTELAQMMSSGDVWIAASVWQDTFGLLREEGIPVDYIDPAEGRFGWVCGYGISSETEDLDLAHAYLDAVLDPESIANLGNEYWYGTANPKGVEYMDPEVVELFQLDDLEVLNQAVLYKTLTAENRQKMTTLWDEVKIAP